MQLNFLRIERDHYDRSIFSRSMASLLSKDAFGSGSGSNQEQSEQCDSYRLSADVSESESCSNNFSCQQFETKCGASSSMTSSSRPVAINFLFPTSVMLSVIGGKEWWFGTRRSPRNRKPICPVHSIFNIYYLVLFSKLLLTIL